MISNRFTVAKVCGTGLNHEHARRCACGGSFRCSGRCTGPVGASQGLVPRVRRLLRRSFGVRAARSKMFKQICQSPECGSHIINGSARRKSSLDARFRFERLIEAVGGNTNMEGFCRWEQSKQQHCQPMHISQCDSQRCLHHATTYLPESG